jgi:3'(2'), 5'-bisphosphate nucleotidase
MTGPDGADAAQPTEADHRLAAELAEEAGVLLLRLRQELVDAGADSATLKAEGDRQSHELLMARLAERAPRDAVLSEEGSDDPVRLDADRVWIVDPLDGTREYSEPPRADWAVHVALAIGGRPAAGAVALPAQRLTLATQPAPPPPVVPPAQPRLIVSRTRPPRIAVDLATHLGGALVEMGSAGAKVGAVIMGAAEIYAHAGGQYEWDSCAPVAVAAACGLHVSRLDGSPLVYNNADPYLPDLLVCHPQYADQVLAFTRAWSPNG